jgi:hypothetical protein
MTVTSVVGQHNVVSTAGAAFVTIYAEYKTLRSNAQGGWAGLTPGVELLYKEKCVPEKSSPGSSNARPSHYATVCGG